MKRRIHVNLHNIKFNRRNSAFDKPVLSVKSYKGNVKCFNVEIDGPSKVIYSPDKPLSCGAVVWIETEAGVIVT